MPHDKGGSDVPHNLTLLDISQKDFGGVNVCSARIIRDDGEAPKISRCTSPGTYTLFAVIDATHHQMGLFCDEHAEMIRGGMSL